MPVFGEAAGLKLLRLDLGCRTHQFRASFDTMPVRLCSGKLHIARPWLAIKTLTVLFFAVTLRLRHWKHVSAGSTLSFVMVSEVSPCLLKYFNLRCICVTSSTLCVSMRPRSATGFAREEQARSARPASYWQRHTFLKLPRSLQFPGPCEHVCRCRGRFCHKLHE